MEPGQYLDTWGARWNAQGGSDLIDAALDGVESFALSGSKTLTNNNGAADEARKRVLNITGGTGGTITIPNVSKVYLVRNNSSADVTFTTGSGTTTAVKSGAIVLIFCDGSNAVYQAIRPDFGSANISTTGTLTAGSVLASGTGGVGYTAGAGGTATQSTNKSTTVVLNELSGQITMNNAALAAGTSVQFTFNNSTIASSDVVIVNIVSGATSMRYHVIVETVGVGSCSITLRNYSGGSLSEAVVLGFAVVKGSTT